MYLFPASWLSFWSANDLLKTKRQAPAKRRISRACWPLGSNWNLKACCRFMPEIIPLGLWQKKLMLGRKPCLISPAWKPKFYRIPDKKTYHPILGGGNILSWSVTCWDTGDEGAFFCGEQTSIRKSHAPWGTIQILQPGGTEAGKAKASIGNNKIDNAANNLLVLFIDHSFFFVIIKKRIYCHSRCFTFSKIAMQQSERVKIHD